MVFSYAHLHMVLVFDGRVGANQGTSGKNDILIFSYELYWFPLQPLPECCDATARGHPLGALPWHPV
jgi:hypothetical protein